MNEVLLDKEGENYNYDDEEIDHSHQPQTSVNRLISTQEELNQLAGELADNYVEYLTIDTSEVKRKSEESIEECLIHLEEVSSVLESYKENCSDIEDVVKDISKKEDDLSRLYKQIDDLEQYIYVTRRTVENLENTMKELENQKKSLNSGNKIRQIIDLLPRFKLSTLGRF